jgi:hypothetical protein
MLCAGRCAVSPALDYGIPAENPRHWNRCRSKHGILTVGMKDDRRGEQMQNERTTTATVMARLDKLERQNRRFRFALASMALLSSLLLFVGAAPSIVDPVTAKKFVLLDDAGRARGVLETNDGNPDLALDGADGQRAVFGIAPTGPARFILSGKADGAVEASVSQNGGLAHLSIQSAKDNDIGLMAISKDAVGILVHSSRGKGFELTAGPYPVHTDGPALTLYDDGNPRLTLGEANLTNGKTGGGTSTPVSTITAFDKNGNVTGSWP